MTNNDILKRVCYALRISDVEVLEFLKLSDYKKPLSEIKKYFKKDDDIEYIVCNDTTINAFLDGLIIKKRGKR